MDLPMGGAANLHNTLEPVKSPVVGAFKQTGSPIMDGHIGPVGQPPKKIPGVHSAHEFAHASYKMARPLL
jgi:hypothetical protein